MASLAWPGTGTGATAPSGHPDRVAVPETAPVPPETAPNIITAFDVTGATAVADAMARCADPATCGSEFEADGYASRTVTCSRCGLTGVLDHDLVAELDTEVRS